MGRIVRALAVALIVLPPVVTTAFAAEEYNPARTHPTTASDDSIQRVIVKFRSGAEEVEALADHAGVAVQARRQIGPGMHALQVQPQSSGQTLAATLAALRADPTVEYAEPDLRRYPHAVPNDPAFNAQWFLQADQPAALDATDAWDVTAGSTGVVIAELDTGVRFDHPDLRSPAGNRLLAGYDFISADWAGAFFTANDGDGRDGDASDPGDWVSSQDKLEVRFKDCKEENSSWHGTRVAGVLGALTNNATGVAGITWNNWILPVRVLGKCGGYDSDIIAAMLWAAGGHVDRVADNPYPARIINMSLGATGPCLASYRSVIDQLVGMGVLVVVSAGNEGGPVDSPANCPGVAGVAGLRQIGTKVGFSSLGPEIALSAPGGNCVNTAPGQPCLFSINTTTNSGTTVPATNTYTDQFNLNVGTSFSAPMVSGIAGLMLAVNGNLRPAQLIARLKEGATRPFPVSSDPAIPVCHVPNGQSDLQTAECSCTTQTCGAGMANASGSVQAALRPIAAVRLPAVVSPGSTLSLMADGSAAACNHTISSYAWTVVSSSGGAPTIQSANTADASVVAPTAPDTYTLRVTVTDDAGRTDSANVTITAISATSGALPSAGTNACPRPIAFGSTGPAGPVSANPPGSGSSGTGNSGSGGGGGEMDWLLLAAATAALAVRVSRNRPSGTYKSRVAASSQDFCARR
ncbi:MAG TPA: S8 family serine peptidase [Steroidobacteraceae bacterium]|jgi:serine protease